MRAQANTNYGFSHQEFQGIKVLIDQMNSRVKILNNSSINSRNLKAIKKLAHENEFGKIIAFFQDSKHELFTEAGFELEGRIKSFFRGQDALCYSYFADDARRQSANNNIMCADTNNADCTATKKPTVPNQVDRQLIQIRNACEEDINQMTALFRSVFTSYPAPVFDGEYIRNNIRQKKVLYKVALYNRMIVGIASAELDPVQLNAEMTDCVTNPYYRGNHILTSILIQLEEQLKNDGYRCLFSLSRAANPAINKAFERIGFSYSGCLVKNCHMCGSFEDMNIWVKTYTS